MSKADEAAAGIALAAFDKMFGKADEMLKRAEGVFADMPFYKSSETITTTSEPLNAPMEYKVVPVHDLSNSQGKTQGAAQHRMTVELNKLGADGWDLIHYDGGNAIFSRFAE